MSPMINRVLAVLMTAVLIAVGLMFSAVLLAFIAVAGTLAFGYVWWKTRALRRQMREMRQAGQAGNEVFKDTEREGDIIEGEVVRKVISIEEIRRE